MATKTNDTGIRKLISSLAIELPLRVPELASQYTAGMKRRQANAVRCRRDWPVVATQKVFPTFRLPGPVKTDLSWRMPHGRGVTVRIIWHRSSTLFGMFGRQGLRRKEVPKMAHYAPSPMIPFSVTLRVIWRRSLHAIWLTLRVGTTWPGSRKSPESSPLTGSA